MPDFQDLLAAAARLGREHIFAFATVVALSTAAGIAYDLAPVTAAIPTMLLFSLLNLYLQALLTAAALGLEPARTAGRCFASVFGLSLISSIGILLGLLLLLIPGLLLLLRWSVCLPVLLSEQSGVSESLQRSWRLTAGRWWIALPILALFVLAYGPLITLYSLTAYPDSPLWLTFLANIYVALVIAFQWLLVVAVYRALREDAPPEDLPSIFS